MLVLIDTNVLLRFKFPDHPHHSAAQSALKVLKTRGDILCVASQNLIEAWAVMTRTVSGNGFGLNPLEALAEMDDFRRFFRVLPQADGILEAWQTLVTAQEVRGKQTHDAHLVAVMQVHSVPAILTFNDAHFRRFPDISVIHPSAL